MIASSSLETTSLATSCRLQIEFEVSTTAKSVFKVRLRNNNRSTDRLRVDSFGNRNSSSRYLFAHCQEFEHLELKIAPKCVPDKRGMKLHIFVDCTDTH